MRAITTTVGPNAAGGTRNMVRMDDWGSNYISIQCNVTGTVNYTVQSSLDDPNDPTSPVPVASMTWISSSDAAAVGATVSIQTNFMFLPRWIGILMNSGTGTVVATILQSGGSPH
jgi:hypothetical protein